PAGPASSPAPHGRSSRWRRGPPGVFPYGMRAPAVPPSRSGTAAPRERRPPREPTSWPRSGLRGKLELDGRVGAKRHLLPFPEHICINGPDDADDRKRDPHRMGNLAQPDAYHTETQEPADRAAAVVSRLYAGSFDIVVGVAIESVVLLMRDAGERQDGHCRRN